MSLGKGSTGSKRGCVVVIVADDGSGGLFAIVISLVPFTNICKANKGWWLLLLLLWATVCFGDGELVELLDEDDEDEDDEEETGEHVFKRPVVDLVCESWTNAASDDSGDGLGWWLLALLLMWCVFWIGFVEVFNFFDGWLCRELIVEWWWWWWWWW